MEEKEEEEEEEEEEKEVVAAIFQALSSFPALAQAKRREVGKKKGSKKVGVHVRFSFFTDWKRTRRRWGERGGGGDANNCKTVQRRAAKEGRGKSRPLVPSPMFGTLACRVARCSARWRKRPRPSRWKFLQQKKRDLLLFFAQPCGLDSPPPHSLDRSVARETGSGNYRHSVPPSERTKSLPGGF